MCSELGWWYAEECPDLHVIASVGVGHHALMEQKWHSCSTWH